MSFFESRLSILDGQRGIAAVIVMLFHFCFMVKIEAFEGGYLAVDFFFILSGFVIEKAYGEKLRGGLTTRKFIQARIIRLYPAYFIGFLVGAFRAFRAIMSDFSLVPVLGISLAANALLLPSPVSPTSVFLINTPAWSLSLELAVNLLFAAILVRSRDSINVLFVLLAAIAIAYGALRLGHLDLGASLETYHFGIARCVFGFVLGTLIYRNASHFRFAIRSPFSYLEVGFLALVLSVSIPDEARPYFDIVAVFILFPLLLIASARTIPSSYQAVLFSKLGDISYPIYVVHYPLGAILLSQAARQGLSPTKAVAVASVGCVIASIVLAWLDEIFRRWIATKLRASSKKLGSLSRL